METGDAIWKLTKDNYNEFIIKSSRASWLKFNQSIKLTLNTRNSTINRTCSQPIILVPTFVHPILVNHYRF